MDLERSQVHRNLDGSLKVMGLEAPDLIFVLIIAAVLNLFFGETSLVIPMVLGVPLLLLMVLYFGKKGKPSNYLIHLVRYIVSPGHYSVGEKSKNEKRMKKYIYE